MSQISTARSTTKATTGRTYSYLPNDTMPFWQAITTGFQHMVTMFAATTLVALLTGFHVSTVLTFSGLGTIVALILSRLAIGTYIPLYYGASFSYLAAVMAITKTPFGQTAPDSALSLVQVGFVATAVVNVAVGLFIRISGGKQALDKVLPPTVTGSVATVIGVALSKAALDMAGGISGGIAAGSTIWWSVALVTILTTIFFSVYLRRGFLSLIPILLGAMFGYLISIPLGLVNFAAMGQSALIRAPHITLPNFGHANAWSVAIGIGILAVATIPESTAHLYQIGLYTNKLADELRRPRPNLQNKVGLNLIIDGVDDLINGLFGGVGGTNYGENNALMAITRNYSGVSLLVAGAIAVALGFVGPLADLVSSIPTAVIGGLSVYLFGIIGVQGLALLMSEKVDLFRPHNAAVVAIILTIGIGGSIGYPGGFLPIPFLQSVFPNGWPAIATAAVAGIVLNLVFTKFTPPDIHAT